MVVGRCMLGMRASESSAACVLLAGVGQWARACLLRWSSGLLRLICSHCEGLLVHSRGFARGSSDGDSSTGLGEGRLPAQERTCCPLRWSFQAVMIESWPCRNSNESWQCKRLLLEILLLNSSSSQLPWR